MWMKTSFKLNEGNCVSKLDIHDRNNTLLKVLDFDLVPLIIGTL